MNGDAYRNTFSLNSVTFNSNICIDNSFFKQKEIESMKEVINDTCGFDELNIKLQNERIIRNSLKSTIHRETTTSFKFTIITVVISGFVCFVVVVSFEFQKILHRKLQTTKKEDILKSLEENLPSTDFTSKHPQTSSESPQSVEIEIEIYDNETEQRPVRLDMPVVKSCWVEPETLL